MALAPAFVERLRCPRSGQRLALAPAAVAEALDARRREGTLSPLPAQPQWNAEERFEEVLIREDGEVGYAVQGGIPLLLPDHGFVIEVFL